MPDTKLPVPVRGKMNSPFRKLVRTIGEAIDAVEELPEAKRNEAHWHDAQEKLFVYLEAHTDQALTEANVALQRALTTEKWSD
jgi:hypothetical protein